MLLALLYGVHLIESESFYFLLKTPWFWQ